jgi:hypothetical protein
METGAVAPWAEGSDLRFFRLFVFRNRRIFLVDAQASLFYHSRLSSL